MTSETGVAQPTPSEQQHMVEAHPDYILLKRFEYSAEKALRKYPDGLPENLVAQALGKPTAWVTRRYKAIVEKLRGIVIPESK